MEPGRPFPYPHPRLPGFPKRRPIPKFLPDTVWICERPEDHPAGEQFLVSTHESVSGNPEPFARKAKADRLDRAVTYAQEALERADRMLPDDVTLVHNTWADVTSALMDYDPKGDH